MCKTLEGSHPGGCTCPESEGQSLDPESRRWIEEALSGPTQTGGTGCGKIRYKWCQNDRNEECYLLSAVENSSMTAQNQAIRGADESMPL